MRETPADRTILRELAKDRMDRVWRDQRGMLAELEAAGDVPSIAYSFSKERPFAEQPKDLDAALDSSLGTAELWTSSGGKYSKYGSINEDACAFFSSNDLLYVGVVDGAGGSSDGSTASRVGLYETTTGMLALAAEQALWGGLYNKLTTADLDKALIHRANEQLLLLTNRHKQQTTRTIDGAYGAVSGLVRLRIPETAKYKTFVYAQGDTRVMQLRGGDIVTSGTSWFLNEAGRQAAIKGDGADYWEDYDRQAQLLAGIGDPASHEHGAYHPEDIGCWEVDARPGDVFLLYSDGVGDIMTDHELKHLAQLCRAPSGTIDAKALHARIRLFAKRRNASTNEGVSLLASEDRRIHFIMNQVTSIDRMPYIIPGADNQTLITLQIPQP